MITKGTTEYREAQKTANIIEDYSLEVVSVKDSSSQQKYDELHWALSMVQKLGVFASQVAETLLGQMNRSHRMPNVSSKQAWIIACAMIENEIYLD